jgi:hypothetical protein
MNQIKIQGLVQNVQSGGLAPASEPDDPFAAFSEWSGPTDEKAYDNLRLRKRLKNIQ